MDIPINAKVYCQDKLCGRTQAVVLNPINDVITHVVVKESKNSHAERLVSVDMIDASLTDTIHLKLNERMLQRLPTLFDVEYIQTTVPHFMQAYSRLYLEPVVIPEKRFVEEKLYHIPEDELAINRGAVVLSADGQVIGKVDEFLVDQNGWQVTHLIIREKHIFSQKDVFIPVAEIDAIKGNNLHLKLDKAHIERFPAIPVRHLWS